MTGRIVLAVDGGNSKTDVALVDEDGRALALVRGPQSSPEHLGVDGCIQVLDELGSKLMEAWLPLGSLRRNLGPSRRRYVDQGVDPVIKDQQQRKPRNRT